MLSTAAVIGMPLAVVFGTYIVTSVIFFKYPNVFYKKKKLMFRCPHISHRGGAGEKLENTLSAFNHAMNLGTNMLELDVHLTKDGFVVVSHDHNLSRVTESEKNISDYNYSDLPPLKRELKVDFDRGKCFRSEDATENRIPLLKQVFESYPHLPINIDIKTNNDLLIKKVSQLIKEYNREEITVWGNFSNEVTEKCYKENPKIPLLFSLKRVVIVVLSMYCGILPFIPLKESCFEVIMPSLLLKMSKEISLVWRITAWLIDKLLIRKALFDHLRKRGIHTYLWVLNTEEDYEKAFRLGATGVMTDYPTKLRKFLDENQKYNNWQSMR